jgi:bleomycin hydrolase
MKFLFVLFAAALLSIQAHAQQSTFPTLKIVKENEFTPVKSQDMTGTCWCYSTTSLVESMALKKGAKDVDISEMFTVHNIYLEKARHYILRQGAAQFGEGGLGHDLIRAIEKYGAVPQAAYTGLKNGQKSHNHGKLETSLKNYLDSILKKRPLADNWIDGYNYILDTTLGVMPTSFEYNGQTYTPQSYAKDVLKFDASEYVSITSFTDHPFYQPFILEVPDNFANGPFYNVTLDEMIDATKSAVEQGYTVAWDADVSNNDFSQGKGFAMLWKNDKTPGKVDADEEEKPYDATIRQKLYENLTTEDDHLMHIVGIEKTDKGKEFFIVKNSWGEVGNYKGFINVSIPYFAINTISLVIPKAALSKELKKKLGIK